MTKHFKPSNESIPLPAEKPQSEPEPVVTPAPELPPAPVLVEEPAPVIAPQPPSPDPVSQPTQPLLAPEPEPRRSSRQRQAPDRLEMSWGTKSYAQAVKTDPRSLIIKESLNPTDPEGGGSFADGWLHCTYQQQP